MMSLWDALRMNMMISYQELVRTFPSIKTITNLSDSNCLEIQGASLGKVRISRSFLPKLTR